MKNFKGGLILTSLFVTYSIVNTVITFISVDFILHANNLRIDITNLWGNDVVTYLSLILFPLSTIISKVYKPINRNSILTKIVFPFIFVLIFILSISFGLFTQMQNMDTKEFTSITDTPMLFNFNIKNLIEITFGGLLISSGIQVFVTKSINK